MDWDWAIERNRQALKRVLAVLVAMAGLGDRQSAIAGRQSGSAQAADCPLPAADCRLFMPRHLHRAILRLLRPAEAAARRLIVVAARALVVVLPPARPRGPAQKPLAPVLRRLGIAAVIPSAGRAGPAGRTVSVGRAPRGFALALLDPMRAPRPDRPRPVPAHAAPRISFPGVTARHRPPPPPAPDDPLDATRLALRLRALAAALDDLPKHARRFARWRARRDRAAKDGRARRHSPLKPGRPPGWRSRSAHEIHEILADLHGIAHEALAPPDTS